MTKSLPKITRSLQLKFAWLTTACLLFLAAPALASNWVSSPSLCPANDFTNYPAQDCTPQKMCGVVSGTVQCNANTFSAPSSPVTQTASPFTSAVPGGFIIDCETTSGGSSPYCNNGTTGFCNASTTFFTTQHRSTVCSANLFASSTAGACLSSYLDCSGDVACETQIGVTAFTKPNTTYLTCTTGQCSSGYQACNGDTPTANGCVYQTGVTTCTTGDGSPGTYGASCTCVALPQVDIFTNTFASAFGNWWLYGSQTNPTGGLINISNSTTHAGIVADLNANITASGTISSYGVTTTLLFATSSTFVSSTATNLNFSSATGTYLNLTNLFATTGTLTYVNATNVTTTNFTLNTDTITDLTGSGLSVSGGALTVSGLTTGNFSSANISQWTNDSGYLTSVALPATQVGFGSAGNVLTGSSALTYDTNSGNLTFPTGYANTLNVTQINNNSNFNGTLFIGSPSNGAVDIESNGTLTVEANSGALTLTAAGGQNVGISAHSSGLIDIGASDMTGAIYLGDPNGTTQNINIGSSGAQTVNIGFGSSNVNVGGASGLTTVGNALTVTGLMTASGGLTFSGLLQGAAGNFFVDKFGNISASGTLNIYNGLTAGVSSTMTLVEKATTSPMYGLKVLGHFLYATTQNSGSPANSFTIWDLTNPAAPKLVTTTASVGGQVPDTNGGGLWAQGTYVYVPDGSNGLRTFDVSNPYSPKQLAVYTFSDFGMSAAGNGRYVFLASRSNGGVRMFNMSDPSLSSNLMFYTATGSTMGLFATNRYLYVVNTSSWQIADISGGQLNFSGVSAQSAAGFSGMHNEGTSLVQKAIDCGGGFCYIADGAGGVQIANVSNPAAASIVGNYAATNVRDVKLFGHFLGVAQGSNVLILDIASSTNPVLVSTYPAGSAVRRVDFYGKYLYATTDNGLHVVDMQGADIGAARIGALGVGGLVVDDSASIANSLSVGNNVNVGYGGIYNNGGIVSWTTNTFWGNTSFGSTSTPTNPIVVGNNVNGAGNLFIDNSGDLSSSGTLNIFGGTILSNATTTNFDVSTIANIAKLGVNTSSPVGTALSVKGTGTGSSRLLDFANSNNINLFTLQEDGHVAASSTQPTLSSCGTGTVNGTDWYGTITMSSASSGCTLTFATSWTNAPSCSVTFVTNTINNMLKYTLSSSAITMSTTTGSGAVGLTNGTAYYDCKGLKEF